ncbi:unnamed protein product [Effrenium voratum]|nr:unnamed protein product [Effrenium voratum]
MMKRVTAFAREKEQTYEERVAECRAREEAERKKREEDEEEEAKKKKEEEGERSQERQKPEASAEGSATSQGSPGVPPKQGAAAKAQSNMTNQMQMMAMMMGSMGNMMNMGNMGMGGMGMPNMGAGMPSMHLPGQAVAKGQNLQGMVAVKSGHGPPPAAPSAGPPGDFSGIAAVTKSKSAPPPPQMMNSAVPALPPSQTAWSDMKLTAKAPQQAQPPPPPPGNFDRRGDDRGDGFDRSQPNEGSDRRHDGGGEAGRDGAVSAMLLPIEAPTEVHQRRPEALRSQKVDGAEAEEAGGMQEWQERDIQDRMDGPPRGMGPRGGWALFLVSLATAKVQMVTYKRAALLREALEQVKRQRYRGGVEVVVVDDSPEDQREDIEALQDAKVRINYIYLPERMSIGAKRNLGIRNTRAEVIAIWDDDDVFTKDRLRKQVEHLFSGTGVMCSGIEVASFYSVPDQESSRCGRRAWSPSSSTNTLCFTRAWWEGEGYSFGEAWEVSGQGEGTLQEWWPQVDPLSAAEEPFLYIYLPSSASGGTALNKNRRPPPTASLLALSRALLSSRFPQSLGAHVDTAVSSARSEVEELLQMPGLTSDNSSSVWAMTSLRRYRPLAARAPDYPEAADGRLRAEGNAARAVWSQLQGASLQSAGWLLTDRPPVRLFEDFVSEEEVEALRAAARYDGFGRRDRGFVRGAAAGRLRRRMAQAFGVEESYLEPLRVVRYSRPEQGFERHVDWIVDASDPQLELLGQRVATGLLFLDDLPKGVGGETDFPALGLAVTPMTGTALLWPNVDADGRPLPEMIHEGVPLKEREKVVVNVWVRDRPLPTDPAILENLLQSKRVMETLAKRLDSFTQDLSSLKQTMETARNPPGLLSVKLREMEDGTFVAKGSDKGKGKASFCRLREGKGQGRRQGRWQRLRQGRRQGRRQRWQRPRHERGAPRRALRGLPGAAACGEPRAACGESAAAAAGAALPQPALPAPEPQSPTAQR